MRAFQAPAALLGLAALSLLPTALAKPYPPPVHLDELHGLHNASQIEKRDCANGGTPCGWYGALCCTSSEQCYTDANNQAQCGAGSANAPAGGGWVTYTTTWVETVGLETRTSVYSSFNDAPVTATCKNSQVVCGSVCCDSGFYCKTNGQCAMIAGGSSGGILPTASAPLRPTSSTLVVITYTGTPTGTAPFQTPIPTGAAGGLVESGADNGGLSGGAIAGIVIGVLLGLLLLFLLCLFCCARALFDTLLGILGIGGKRKHTHEESYVEEHHHHGGGGGAAGWYGNRPSRPARIESEKKSGFGKGLGMAAALGGLALALGLKRKHDKDEKSTTVSGSSYYYSDYTSASK